MFIKSLNIINWEIYNVILALKVLFDWLPS